MPEGIEDLVSYFAGGYETFRSEHGEVLGSVRRLNPDPLENRADVELTVAKGLDDMDAHRVRQDLKDVRFESP